MLYIKFNKVVPLHLAESRVKAMCKRFSVQTLQDRGGYTAEHLACLGHFNPNLGSGAQKKIGGSCFLSDTSYNHLWLGLGPLGVYSFGSDGGVTCRICGQKIHRRRVVHHVLFMCQGVPRAGFLEAVAEEAERIKEENKSALRPRRVPKWGDVAVLKICPGPVMEALGNIFK